MSTEKKKPISKKYITSKISENIQFVTLANNPKPIVKKDISKGILKYGVKNDYFDYQIWLYLNSPSHGSIVNGKARYLSGLNLKPKDPNPRAEEWLKQSNIHGLFKKLDLDECISGNEYTLVHSNIIGTPLTFKHLEFAKCRISECMTEVYYSEDWSNTRDYPIVCYPIWKQGIVEPSVMVYKRYTPSAKKIDSAYGLPEYNSCITDVDTDTEVNTFFNSLVKNGFSAGTIITIFSGKIPKEKQDEIKAGIIEEGEGSMNAGRTIFSFANEGAKGAEIAQLNSNDLDKQFQEVSKRNLQNILIGHGVSAVLFKLQTPGTLGQRNELIEAHELFLNEYVKPKQERRLLWCKEQYKLKTGQEVEFEFEQVQDIGIDFTDPNISKYLTNEEMREKIGLTKLEEKQKSPSQMMSDALNTMSPLVATKVLEMMTEDEVRSLANLPPKTIKPTNPDGTPIVEEEAQVNDVLKNLTGRQMQGLMRIVKKYDDEKLSKEQAMLLMQQGFGVTEEQAKTLLMIADEDEEVADQQIHQCSHVHLSKKQNIFFTLFAKYAHKINHQDEVIEFEYIDPDKVNFAVAVKSNDIKNFVLDKIKENEKVSAKEIAKELGVDTSEINDAMNWLKEKGLISSTSYGFTPTKKALSQPKYKTEIYTEYTYELRPELKAKGQSPLLSTSHDFCVKMYAETRDKALSYEEINSLTNDFGENAFDFRGGYTTRKGSGVVDPWCRHVWKAQTKIRRVQI